MRTQGRGRGAGKKGGRDPVGRPKPSAARTKLSIDSTEDDLAYEPDQNPTVMKQAAALLEEVLAQAGGSLEDIGEMDLDPASPEDAAPVDAPGQNPTVVKQAAELLEQAFLEAGGSLDDIGELDGEPSPDMPAPPVSESSFAVEVGDEESEDEPLVPPFAMDADLSPPDDWGRVRPHEPDGETATPDPAVEDRDGAPPKSKRRFFTVGWLIGAVAAVAVGVGVPYVAAKLSAKPPAETAAASAAAPRDPVAPPAQSAETAEPREPEPVASNPTPSASISAEPSPSAEGSVAAPAPPAIPPPVTPRRPYRPPPAPKPRPRGNLEDIYE